MREAKSSVHFVSSLSLSAGERQKMNITLKRRWNHTCFDDDSYDGSGVEEEGR